MSYFVIYSFILEFFIQFHYSFFHLVFYVNEGIEDIFDFLGIHGVVVVRIMGVIGEVS